MKRPAVRLPCPNRELEEYTLSEPRHFDKPTQPFNRRVLAGPHVVADPLSSREPWLEAALDWDATMAFRRHLWSWGIGVGEALGGAQRGAGLDWHVSLELIRRTLDAARDFPGAVVVSGAGTDQLEPGPTVAAAQVIDAYEEQCEAIEKLGGRIVLRASRALAACALSPEAYGLVYDRVLKQVKEPVIIQWLGEMFDPAMRGYWGTRDTDEAMDLLIALLRRNARKVDGVWFSLLDREREIALRQRLPEGMRMYTGDGFHFAELVAGDGHSHSDALLGILDPVAPAASAALSALAQGDHEAYDEILRPAMALSRHIFCAPTRFYRTGVVFMAWLNGHQDHFVMVGGQQSARNVLHFAEIFRLADKAGLLSDPERAAIRMKQLLAVHGIGG